MKKILTILSLAFFILGYAYAQYRADRKIIRIHKHQWMEKGKELRALNLDLLMEKDGNIYIVASPQDLASLEAKNIPYNMEYQAYYPEEQGKSSIQSGVNGAFHS
jgi:hypothetical protein